MMADLKRLLVVVFLSAMITPVTSSTPVQAREKCSITGVYNFKSSHKSLTKNLCKLSRVFGTVEVTSSCRTRKQNRSVKNSYHLYSRGCKAADVQIKGVKGSTILKWWGKNVGGGRGSYRCRRFVHVDVGPARTWHWNTKCK